MYAVINYIDYRKNVEFEIDMVTNNKEEAIKVALHYANIQMNNLLNYQKIVAVYPISTSPTITSKHFIINKNL
jgi:hypothetical protein